MEKVKEVVLYIIVAFLVVGIIYLFFNIFAFNQKNENSKQIEITTELIEELYSYLPTLTDSNMSSMYNKNFTSNNNLGYTLINKIAYNYIKNYNSSKIEGATESDKIQTNLPVISKINIKYIDEATKHILGKDIKYDYKSFNIDGTTAAAYQDKYLYIYTNGNNLKKYIIYKNITSYIVTDNGKTIKIYDYFLKCDKNTKMCYNDDAMTFVNGYITYQDNMNINEKSKVQTFEHTFKLEGNHYYWFKTEMV